MNPARAFWLLTYLLFFAVPAHAEPPAADPKQVTLKADTLTIDVPADSYRARGSVRVVRTGRRCWRTA